MGGLPSYISFTPLEGGKHPPAMSLSLHYQDEQDPCFQMLQMPALSGDGGLIYVRNKSAKYAAKSQMLPAEAFFFASSKALSKKKEFPEGSGQSVAFAVASAHSHAVQACQLPRWHKRYFNPESTLRLQMCGQGGCQRFQLEGKPQQQRHCEDSFALKLYNKQGCNSQLPPCGELTLDVAYRLRDRSDRAHAIIQARYDLPYLARQAGCCSSSSLFYMCVPMYSSPCESELQRVSAPLSKARLEFRLLGQGGSGYALNSIEIFNDYPQLRYRRQPPLVHRSIGAQLIGDRAGSQHSNLPPAALSSLSQSVQDALKPYTLEVKPGSDDAFEYVLSDCKGTTSITNVAPDERGQFALWGAGSLARTILAAAILRHAFEITPPDDSSQGSVLDDPSFLLRTLGADSPMGAALASSYADRLFPLPTLRQLLLDSAGLPSFLPLDAQTVIQDIQGDKVTPPTEAAVSGLMAKNMSPLHPPGSKIMPSDVGSIVLLQLLQRLEHHPPSQEEEGDPEALQKLLLRQAQSLFGMKHALYDPNKEAANRQRMAKSEQPYLPGPYGLASANVGLYVTTEDLGNMMSTLLNPAAPAYILALLQPRNLMARDMPIAVGFGETQIDDQSVQDARVIKLGSTVPCGHSIQLLLFPERQVGVAYATNTPCEKAGYTVHAGTPSRLLSALESADTHPPRFRAERTKVGVPSGYPALFSEQVATGRSSDDRQSVMDAKKALLAQVGGMKLISMMGADDGGAESVEVRDIDDTYRVVIVHNRDPLTQQWVLYDPRTKSYRLQTQDGILGDFLKVESVQVEGAPEGSTQLALRLNGQVFFSKDAEAALISSIEAREEEESKDVDEDRANINAQYAAEVNKIGSLWPFIAGLAVGGLAVAVIAPWNHPRRYIVPVYGYPYYVHRRPYHSHFVNYIRADVNELDEEAKMHDSSGLGTLLEDEEEAKHDQVFVGQRRGRRGGRRGRGGRGGRRRRGVRRVRRGLWRGIGLGGALAPALFYGARYPYRTYGYGYGGGYNPYYYQDPYQFYY